MDHDLVVRDKMTEKYLLEELGPELREEFEEHFFDCPECALDVRAASELVTHSRNVLKENSDLVVVHKAAPVREPASRGWFAWLRPAFAVPVMALLLVVIGVQTVTLQHLAKKANQPQILPAATLNLLTYGSNSAPLVIQAGQGFLLNVIVPPGHRYAAYRVDLQNPSGTTEASLPVKDSIGDTWPITFPAENRASGTYKVDVHGLTDSGQEVEVGTSSFELRIEK